jgi:hypothetical protein
VPSCVHQQSSPCLNAEKFCFLFPITSRRICIREEPHLAADLADSGIHSDTKSSCCLGWIKKSICYLAAHVREDKFNWLKLLLAPAKATTKLPQDSKIFGLAHTQDAHEYNYIVERPHQLCFDYAVRRDYSSSGLHRLYCVYAVHPDAPSHSSTSRRSVALSFAVRPVTASRGATTHRPDCTGSTAPVPCIWTRRLAARLLVGRSHWLSPCVRSLHLAARLLIVHIAPALLRLCRASGRAVSPLDFSSVGRTGSRRVHGHSIVRRDYPSRGCNGYTSTTPRIRAPRHIARLVRRLVAPLIDDYFALRTLVVNFFAYAARPGALARRAARHAAHH